jgi:capsular exopolysaccharide synthesis family protein
MTEPAAPAAPVDEDPWGVAAPAALANVTVPAAVVSVPETVSSPLAVAPLEPAAPVAATPVAATPVAATPVVAAPVVAAPVVAAPIATAPIAQPAAQAVAAPAPIVLEETPGSVLITKTTRFDAIEQYRKLAAALHEAQSERAMRTVLCTSALMGEGKTVTASNLALTLSESYGRRVLLIDADLRRPQIHSMFDVSNAVGLGDALSAREDSKLAVHRVTERLSIVTAGQPSSNPMTGLTSGRLRDVIAEAAQRFDWVIVDTPPVLLLPDARVLVSMVDAVLLVVRAGSTPFRTVLRAVDVIKRDRIFGTVLNSVEDVALDEAYGGYGQYYGAAKTA